MASRTNELKKYKLNKASSLNFYTVPYYEAK